MRTSFPLLMLLLAACDRTPAANQAVRVLVDKEAGVRSTCAKIWVTSSEGVSQSSDPIPLTDRDGPYRVALYRGALPERVSLRAVGYSDARCSEPTSPAEESASSSVVFSRTVTEVSLVIGAAPVDEDRDGSPGGVDCDDADPARTPGKTESCNSGKDEDCDGKTDCADESCALADCGPSGTGLCGGGVCRERRCTDGLDDDGDGSTDCADVDCLQAPCGQGGSCGDGRCLAPTESGLCADGVDNDGDGKRDCEDPDCPAGSACDDNDECTSADVCSAAGACAGAQVTCAPYDAAACYGPAGTCSAQDGQCVYAPRLGGCDDGLSCTVEDACDGDCGCAGTPRTCEPPAYICWWHGTSRGYFDGCCGGIHFPAGSGCDDGKNCTVSDRCGADGGCTGTPVVCTAPSECLDVQQDCSPDGGCLFAARTGAACDAGTCAPDGGCVPRRWNNYVPSNFSPWQLPASGGSVVFDCGTTVLETETSDGGFQWSNFCGSAPPPEPVVIDLAGVNGALLYMDSLSISNGSGLSVRGPKPVILAVKNQASIEGFISVGSVYGYRRGAGANRDCNAQQSGAPGTLAGSPQAGGGGGGGAFGGPGGNGGAGGSGAAGAPSGAGGAGGAVRGNETLVPLRGGCPGGNGGGANVPGALGVGASGGGAVQVSVDGPLSMSNSGLVTAYGAGGTGGLADSAIGGGGAGSGGGILLEATTLSIQGWVTANGGSGGEGSGFTAGYDGADGQSGYYASTVRAGTPDTCCGGNGGAGGAKLLGASAGGAAECPANVIGGGGGGGGEGRIRLNASVSCTLNSAVFSPAQSGNIAGCRP